MKNKIIILTCLLLLGSGISSGAETAAQAIRRTSELLRRATGVSVGFAMKSGQGSMKGTIKCAGSKFVMTSPAVSTWFDGRTMWTYNPRSGETTITYPDQSEIAETNPLALISANQENFMASYGKNQPKGSKVIVLTPKKNGLGVKKLEVTIGSTNYLPSRIVITSNGGDTSVITLSGVSTQSKIPVSSFTYPSKNYPKATIVDLR